MNRFTQHLKAAQLAKLHLTQAAQDANKGKTDRALSNVIQAVNLIITDMHNVSSIAFKKKPKAMRQKKREADNGHRESDADSNGGVPLTAETSPDSTRDS